MARRKKERLLRQQPDHRANRTILIRTLILMGIFGVAVFVPLFFQLWKIQIQDYDYYRGLVADQQTKDSTVEANRGTIYDSNGVPLALSATVYNVQLSPKEIIQCQDNYKEKVEQAEKNGKDPPDYPEPTNEFIAENLAEILDLEVDDILARLAKENSLYEMIKWRVEPEKSEAVEQFITENHISGIYLMPTSKRYYPKGSLAAQVIGWVNPNLGEGAYGVEALYEEELAGETGRVVTAKNGVGTEMLYWFEDYYDATNGDDLTLTIDATIQSYCERVLAEGISSYEVRKGGFCLAMDPNTGQVLVCGEDCTRSREKTRRKIGVVFGGELGFYGRATAWENLMFFAALADLGKQRRQEAERVLKAVSLWDAAHQRVGTFSRGMRQRLHIARALLGNPELLLLDEPTNGIDVELAHELRVLIRRLADDGAAVLLTSHSMSEIEHLADRILLIGAGKLVHDGDLDSVRKLSHVTHIDRPATLEESYLALSPMLRRE